MPQRLPILTVTVLTMLWSLPSTAWPQRALDLAESRYQQASRETYHAQKAFDLAVARTREVGKGYQAALEEQRAASRLLADANVTGPRAADKVRQAERALEAERERVAPQYAPVEAAVAQHRQAVDRAIAQMPEWLAVRANVANAETAYDAAVEDRFAALAEADETYLGLLIESWDAEDAAIALRDTPNVDTNKLIEATQAWMASLDALERYEADAMNADPSVRVPGEALAREEDNEQAVRERLARGVANDPDVQSAAAALAAAENAFWADGANMRRLQADLDVQRAELARVDQVAASARERLARVEPNLRVMADELTKLDEAARRAQDEFVAAQGVEQRALQEREQLAADIARDTYVPEPVYVETPVYVDSATTIYYPPADHGKHHHHDRDKDFGRAGDRDYGRDSDRGNDRGRDSDTGANRAGGARRDDGVGPARGRDDGGARRDDTAPRGGDRGDGGRDHDGGRLTPVRGGDKQAPAPARPNGGDDEATARRKQEEAKAAERHRREDAAAGAARQQQQQQKANDDSAARAAAARQREESSRAAAQRQEESNRRQQQQSEAASRQQQQQRERNERESSSSSSSSSSGASSSSGDRGDRYRRK